MFHLYFSESACGLSSCGSSALVFYLFFGCNLSGENREGDNKNRPDRVSLEVKTRTRRMMQCLSRQSEGVQSESHLPFLFFNNIHSSSNQKKNIKKKQKQYTLAFTHCRRPVILDSMFSQLA